jgi:ABC-2 type transport system ATP-binding protein
MSLIQVSHLNKNYGVIPAIKDFSFTADEKEILALVGPDGAGKTSIFRAICGLIQFDSGGIQIAGFDVSRDFENIKPQLGYMPQNFSLYPDLSVEENLYFYSGLFGLSRQQFNQKKKLLYEFSGLGPFHDRRAAALSGGMKQKLALSCALIHDPKVLILDEPTTGVDPLSRRQFWDILIQLKNEGTAIVVSTPYMDEVALSNRAILIFQGTKLAEGTPPELVHRFTGKVYLVKVQPTTERMDKLNRMEGLAARRFGSSIHLYTRSDLNITSFSTELEILGIMLGLIEETSPDLEDVFIQLMGK